MICIHLQNFKKCHHKFEADVYYKILRFAVLPQLNETYPNNIYMRVFVHTTNKVSKFCQKLMASFWLKGFWLPHSVSLNILTYGRAFFKKRKKCHPLYLRFSSLQNRRLVPLLDFELRKDMKGRFFKRSLNFIFLKCHDKTSKNK